jgi:hypothetical protein
MARVSLVSAAAALMSVALGTSPASAISNPWVSGFVYYPHLYHPSSTIPGASILNAEIRWSDMTWASGGYDHAITMMVKDTRADGHHAVAQLRWAQYDYAINAWRIRTRFVGDVSGKGKSNTWTARSVASIRDVHVRACVMEGTDTTAHIVDCDDFWR